ncbi:MAG TPA: hypothetical protein VF712_19280 [Thermoleophilaceae bacterium]|jgi:hypothetical protein
MLLGHNESHEEPRLPPRGDVERRLLNGGLQPIVAEAGGLSTWEIFVRQLAQPRVLAVSGLFPLIWFVAWTFMTSVSDVAPSRFMTLAAIDVAAGGCLVLVLTVWYGTRRRDGPLAARKIGFAGSAVLAAYLLTPHLLLATGLLDPQFSDSLVSFSESDLSGSPGSGGQPLYAHAALVGGAAGVFGLEAKFKPLGRLGALSRSALDSLLSTVGDVLRTLPVIIAALFFLSFVEEIWKVVGELDWARVTFLNGLLLLCVVAFIRSLARDEAEKTYGSDAEGEEDDEMRLTDVVKPTRAAKPAPDDPHIAGMMKSGVDPRRIAMSKEVKRMVVRQWTVQISIRVLLAGLIIAVLAFVVIGLTVTPAILEEWLLDRDPTGVTVDVGFALYFSLEALSVSTLVGSFAMVAFTAYALGETDHCERLLGPSRARMNTLLTLAGTYQDAVEKGVWRGRPGATWPSYAAFLADDPARRSVHSISFGKRWRSPSHRARRVASWNPETGELYVVRQDSGHVEVLAVTDLEGRIRDALAGWEEQERKPDGLDWLRARAAELAAGAPAPAPAPA